MKKTLALVGLLAIAGLGVGVLTGCHKDEPVDPDPGTVDNDGPEECDHDWVETSHVDATCLEEGSVTYTCAVCGETETLTVPALGHKWSEAVYTEETKWVRTCERCDAVEEFTLQDLPSDAVLAATSETELESLVSKSGVTIALAGTVEGDETPTFTFSSTLEVTGSDVTFVVGEGTAVTTGQDQSITTSALISVSDGASLTLELGEDASFSGYAGQYKNDSGNTERYGLIDVANGGELVINGGEGSTVTQTYGAAPVLTVEVGGKCTVNGGDFTVKDATNYVVINDGELTINGGVFSTENDGSSLIISGDNNIGTHSETEKPVLTINGGVFQGGKHIVKNALEGTLTINGGHFDGYKVSDLTSNDLIDNEGAVAYITGGVFGQDPNNLEEGHEAGDYKNVIAVKSGTSDFASTVTITGGEFYKGSSSWFTFGDSSKGINATAYDSVVIADSVWEVLGTAIEAENQESSPYTISQENGNHVVISASVSSAGGGN